MNLQAEKTSMILMFEVSGMPKYLGFRGWSLKPAALFVGILVFTLLFWKRAWHNQELSLTEGSDGKALHISCHAEKKPLIQMRFSPFIPLNLTSPQFRILCYVSGVSFRD